MSDWQVKTIWGPGELGATFKETLMKFAFFCILVAIVGLPILFVAIPLLSLVVNTIWRFWF